jgi:membrane protein
VTSTTYDVTSGADERGRGRDADTPRQIPAKGWKDILARVRSEAKEDQLPLVSAAVAFYALLAIFPAMIALVTIYGLVADPADVERQLAGMSEMLPETAREVIGGQMRGLAGQSSGALSFGLVASLLGALWVASGGAFALIRAVNIAYDEEERRGFLKLRALALLFTLAGIVLFGVVVFLIGVLPAIFAFVGLGDVVQRALEIGRWPLLAALAAFAISAVYRYAPCRTKPKWRWVTWGGAVAPVVWLGATALFSYYVSSFGNYQQTYGAIGGVIVLLLWLYITSFAVLFGAELDAEMEHQTTRDSTVGEPAPMGERGAQMADTVGPRYSR